MPFTHFSNSPPMDCILFRAFYQRGHNLFKKEHMDCLSPASPDCAVETACTNAAAAASILSSSLKAFIIPSYKTHDSINPSLWFHNQKSIGKQQKQKELAKLCILTLSNTWTILSVDIFWKAIPLGVGIRREREKKSKVNMCMVGGSGGNVHSIKTFSSFSSPFLLRICKAICLHKVQWPTISDQTH